MSVTTPRRRGLDYSGYVFAAPYLLLFAAFIILPLVYGLGLSLFRWDMLAPRPPQFVGLNNFQEAVGDQYFWKALLASFRFVVMAVPLTVLLGLAIAAGIHTIPMNRQAFYRAAYYLPTVITISVAGDSVAMVFQQRVRPVQCRPRSARYQSSVDYGRGLGYAVAGFYEPVVDFGRADGRASRRNAEYPRLLP